MDDLGQHLCDLIRQAVAAEEPDEALRLVPELRDGLAAFERAQVTRALRRGASYGDVAQVLGISRQAAHKRYRAALDDGVDGDAPEAGGRILVTSEARAVVALAREEASALGAGRVGTEHLLLGIMRFGDPCIAAALHELGVDLATVRAHAEGTLADGSLHGVAEGRRGISPHARAVFERSLHEAVHRGDGYIGVEHLLIATVCSDEGGAHRTLEALGVDPSALIDRV